MRGVEHDREIWRDTDRVKERAIQTETEGERHRER